jgi:hypothetical protein
VTIIFETTTKQTGTASMVRWGLAVHRTPWSAARKERQQSSLVIRIRRLLLGGENSATSVRAR